MFVRVVLWLLAGLIDEHDGKKGGWGYIWIGQIIFALLCLSQLGTRYTEQDLMSY